MRQEAQLREQRSAPRQERRPPPREVPDQASVRPQHPAGPRRRRWGRSSYRRVHVVHQGWEGPEAPHPANRVAHCVGRARARPTPDRGGAGERAPGQPRGSPTDSRAHRPRRDGPRDGLSAAGDDGRRGRATSASTPSPRDPPATSLLKGHMAEIGGRLAAPCHFTVVALALDATAARARAARLREGLNAKARERRRCPLL